MLRSVRIVAARRCLRMASTSSLRSISAIGHSSADRLGAVDAQVQTQPVGHEQALRAASASSDSLVEGSLPVNVGNKVFLGEVRLQFESCLSNDASVLAVDLDELSVRRGSSVRILAFTGCVLTVMLVDVSDQIEALVMAGKGGSVC